MYKLQSYKVSLEKQQQLIEPLDNDIAELLEEESIEKEIVEKCEFDNALEEIICLISSVLKNQEESGKSIESESSRKMFQPQLHPLYRTRGELPHQVLVLRFLSLAERTQQQKLARPNFRSSPYRSSTDALQVGDCLASAVHQNSQLDNIEKFQYLKSLLEKTAAETISGLPLTSLNYLEAIELLKARYPDK